MNAVNKLVTAAFDVLLVPFELLGMEWSLILVSGLFGIFALILFKYISWQRGIGLTKDKIKGHMIAIRLYQDDLRVVSQSVGRVLLRNFQYIGLNIVPFIPLAFLFVPVVAQMVVRYAYEPLPVYASAEGLLPGQGTTLQVEFAPGMTSFAEELEIILPAGLEALSPRVANAYDGVAFQEIIATEPGDYSVVFRLADGSVATKRIVAGEPEPGAVQPLRVRSPWEALLWPGEDSFGDGSAFARVSFEYPPSGLGWLPGEGVLGILIVFLVASMLFGIAIIKPLGIKI